MDRAGFLRQLRGALLVLAFAANGVSALPYERKLDEQWEDPEFRKGDLDLWFAWLGPRAPVDRERFGELVKGFIFAQNDLVGALRWPFEPYYKTFHIDQNWNLFAVVAQSADALVVEVRRGGDNWGVLYRRLDPEHDWHDAQLRYRRVRGVWDQVGEKPKGTYKRMAKWIALQAFTEDPDIDRVRVLLEKKPISAPWEPLDEPVTRRAERYHRRHEVME